MVLFLWRGGGINEQKLLQIMGQQNIINDLKTSGNISFNNHTPSKSLKLSNKSEDETEKEKKREEIEKVISTVKSKGWSFLEESALRMHVSLIASTSRLPGVMIECGVANGGTAMVATASKPSSRELHLYDTFSGMPAPSSDHDGKDVHDRYRVIREGKAGRSYYGYNKNLLADIKSRFSSLGMDPGSNHVVFHPGLFQDTLEVTSEVTSSAGVVYAHLDGDWYESTMTALSRIAPRVVAGGYVVVDDYFGYSGCRKAVNEFFDVSEDSVNASSVRRPLVVADKLGRKWSLSKRQRLVIQAL